ncbi:MAG: hypothetical protein VYC39_06710 [Myxococcota bacterium]|nr:hypothetical protein [Myxococcota bacterium]
MSAWSVGLFVLISSTSTVSDSPLPLTEEELRLLDSIEAEQLQATVPTRHKTLAKDKKKNHYAHENSRTWAATLTENVAASDAPIRWTRDEPGHLKPMVKGLASHRSLIAMDGLPIRTMFDGINEIGAAHLFDPQTLIAPKLNQTSLSLQRKQWVPGSGAQGWLTLGSYLRDYGGGLSFGHGATNFHIFGQAAISQPATGYLTAEQNTTRYNAHLRTSNSGLTKSPFSWTIGLDIDEVQDFVRWELDSRGNAIELRRNRMGGFGRWGYKNKFLQVMLQPYYFHYVTEQDNPRAIAGNENVHQTGLQFSAAGRVLENTMLGLELEGQRQIGEHNSGNDPLLAEQTKLRAGFTAYYGNQTSSDVAKSFIKAVLGRELGEQRRNEDTDSIGYFFGSIAGAYQVLDSLQLFGGVQYNPQFPSVKDRIRGSSNEIEHLIHGYLGLTGTAKNLAISAEFYSNQYRDLRISDRFGTNIVRRDSQLDVGSLLTVSWRLSQNIQMIGSNGFEMTSNKNYHYRRLRLVYRHSPRGVLAEASASQWSNTTFWTNLAFQAPFLDERFFARLSLDNIQDYESVRPDSSLPEPELSVRLLLKAAW